MMKIKKMNGLEFERLADAGLTIADRVDKIKYNRGSGESLSRTKSRDMTLREMYEEKLSHDRRGSAESKGFLDEIADATRMTRSAAWSWAKGVREPTRLAKEAISARLGVSVDELFPGKEEAV